MMAQRVTTLKKGTPTMGGIVFLTASIVAYLISHLITGVPVSTSALLVIGLMTGLGIVGFIDGEGCFHISVNPQPTMTCGFQVLPEFTVTQHQRDVKILYALKEYFQCGVVRVNHGDILCYRVRGFHHLNDIIVPFFEKHKLKTKKRIAFERFRDAVLLIEKGEHLTIQGVEKCRKLREGINRTYSSEKLE